MGQAKQRGTYEQEQYNSLMRIARAIIQAKPCMVKGTAQVTALYHSQAYTNMDEAVDWFRRDLALVYTVARESLDEQQAQRLQKELEPVL